MFTDEVKAEIKNTILSYCEGVVHIEFNVNDLDKMINDIESIIKK